MKPHEDEAAYHRRLRHNAYQKRYMRTHPKHAEKRVVVLRAARADAPGLEVIAENERRRSRRGHDRNRSKLNEAKSLPCLDCGNVFPPECMDFDHRPGAVKLFSIGMNLRRSWSSIEAEIAKCDLVCANCHRIRTAARGRSAMKPRAGG